jgi:lysozyme
VSAIDIALPRLETEEGFRNVAYKDSKGNLTVGYGFNINAGISQMCAGALLTAQLQELQSRLLTLQWYAALDNVRQSVCLDIAFNAGFAGLLGFPKMIAALEAQDWTEAAVQCQVQDPELAPRYATLAHILGTGEA